jgi:hypothetical protein
MPSPTYHQWRVSVEVLAAHLFRRAPARWARQALHVTKRFIATGKLGPRRKPDYAYRECPPIIWKILNMPKK